MKSVRSVSNNAAAMFTGVLVIERILSFGERSRQSCFEVTPYILQITWRTRGNSRLMAHNG